MMLLRLIAAVLVTLIGSDIVRAQPGGNSPDDRTIERLLAAVRTAEEAVLADQVSLCEIPAPTFDEGPRAAEYRRRFERLGLTNVRIDRAGNVLGERPGRLPNPHLVIGAHMDTVFEGGTLVAVSRRGSLFQGPGIGDNCRGLAVLLGVIRALDAAKVETTGSLTFVGTVGEEGLGDLRGVKHLFEEELRGRVDRYLSIDGAGVGITHIAVGSLRYRVTVEGPGGHSYGSFGVANPIHAVGRLIQKISNFEVPQEPRTTFSVGRVGGGTSVNSIPSEAWVEVDLRSVEKGALQRLDAQFREAANRAVVEENERWAGRGAVRADVRLVGERPAGRVAAGSAIVRDVISVSEAVGLAVRLSSGSTDANIPISLGIPAISIEGGGLGAGAHAEDETFDATDSWKGTQRAALLAVVLTQP